jgi:transcriptional regulator with XRE-family HTH domain
MSEVEVKGILKNIGEMIRNARINKRWSMAQLAEKSGISSSLISDLENNKGKVPNIFTLISIARALNLADDEFINGFWNQAKTIPKRQEQTSLESTIRHDLQNYGLPQKALIEIMNIINILMLVKKMYHMKYESDETGEIPYIFCHKEYNETQNELLDYYYNHYSKQ